MKSIYTLLFLLVSYGIHSQENLNRTWFLTELVVDGNSIGIPNEEFQDGYPTLSILINDTEGQVEGSGICNGFLSDDAAGSTSANDTSITFNISHTLAVCETSEEINFEFEYFSFLGTPESQDFNYTVVEQGDLSLVLTVVNANGDTAFYSSTNPNLPESLTQEGWYLDFFEIDGVAQNPPTGQDNELNDFTISLFNNSNELEQQFVCLFGGVGSFSAFNYFGAPTISISFIATLADQCFNQLLVDFDNAFLMQLEGKTHTYEIIEEGSGRRLILTDTNGDRIFYTNAFLNTEDFNQDISIQLFPNPTQDKITITGEYTERIQSYQIIDTKGSLITSGIFNATIDVNNLSKGLYFIKLQGNQTETVRRFIKN